MGNQLVALLRHIRARPIMAVVYPGKYCFFVHARTASLSLEAGLKAAHGSAIVSTREHHETAKPQLALCEGGEVKFAVIRNPFDVLVSWLHFSPYSTITDLLDKYEHSWFRNKDGKLFSFFDSYVDEYFRFENLRWELDSLMNELELPQVDMPHLNPTKDKKHYSLYYTDSEIERVYNEFPEIEEYGYAY